MTWASIILLVLKIADALMQGYQQRQQFDAGADAEIAKTSASILSKTEYAKHVRDQVAGLDGPAVDKLLHDLEPK